MLRQVFILLCVVALALALGNGRPFHSKKNTQQKQSKFASVTSYHSSQAAAAPIKTVAPAAPIKTVAPAPIKTAAPVQVAPVPAVPVPYSFGYEAEGSARQESSDASGKVTGSYKVINEDGTIRVVNYVADEMGFRADVDTNEPGTKTSNPSNVEFKSAFVEPPAPAAPMKYATKTSSETKATKSRFEQKPAQFSTDGGAYSYNYEAQLEDGGSIGRSESADGSGSVTGHYSMSVSDGRRRQVDYSSGSQGFQAKIDSNEFGAKIESPANVQFYSSAQQDAAPAPSSYGAPQQQQQISSYSLKPARQEPIQQEAVQYDSKPSPYSFSYDAQMEDGSSSRTESSDGSGKVVGSYSLMTADGRQRTIDYEADHAGFRAKVNTNEFGTQSDSPADAEFYSSAKVEEPSAPAFQNAAQQKISAFPVEQSPLRSNSQIKSTYQPQVSSSNSQFKSTSQDQQSAVQYNADSYANSYSPYAFNYLAELDDGTSSRSESADGSGKVVGSYSLYVDDGRKRTVDYLADQGGFRASVNTNEFGTKSDSPADVQFYSSAVQDEEAPQTYSAKPSSSAFSSQPASKPAPVAQTAYQPSDTPSFKQAPLSQQQVEPEPSYQPSPYSFNYEAEATGGSSARNEASDASGTVTGSYTVRNEDGSVRVVEYIADKNGFRANVKTNEAGTKSDNPADVMVKSDAPVAAPAAPVRQQIPQRVQQQRQQVSKANFPARSASQKSSMVSQENIDAWRR